MSTPGWAIGLVLVVSLCNGVGGLLLKLGADRSRFSWPRPRLDSRLLLGVLFYGVSTVLYVVSLRAGQLSVIYPVVSLSYLWIFLFSRLVLGEKLTPAKLVGGALLIAGVSLIGLAA